MPAFRYYCLDQRGKIVIGGDLEVADLTLAIQAAQESCQAHPIGPFHAVEVWQGTRRLHTSGECCATGREG